MFQLQDSIFHLDPTHNDFEERTTVDLWPVKVPLRVWGSGVGLKSIGRCVVVLALPGSV
jgi:hypothetical protein